MSVMSLIFSSSLSLLCVNSASMIFLDVDGCDDTEICLAGVGVNEWTVMRNVVDITMKASVLIALAMVIDRFWCSAVCWLMVLDRSIVDWLTSSSLLSPS